MAYYEKRGDAWRAQIRRKGHPTLSSTFDTKAEAQRWAAEIEGDRAVLKAVVPGQNMGELRLVEGIAASAQIVREPPAEMQDASRISVKK